MFRKAIEWKAVGSVALIQHKCEHTGCFIVNMQNCKIWYVFVSTTKMLQETLLFLAFVFVAPINADAVQSFRPLAKCGQMSMLSFSLT